MTLTHAPLRTVNLPTAGGDCSRSTTLSADGTRPKFWPLQFQTWNLIANGKKIGFGGGLLLVTAIARHFSRQSSFLFLCPASSIALVVVRKDLGAK